MEKIKLNGLNVGPALSSARKGEQVEILSYGTTSTENGMEHIKFLNGLPAQILSLLKTDYMPSEIKTMVVLISPDLNAEVHINECELTGIAITKASKVEAGQIMKTDDIVGYQKILFTGIEFKEDYSYFCIFPLGWDRIFVFDYTPFLNKEKITYDVEKHLGTLYSYHQFRTYHSILEKDWKVLFNQGWYPFYALKESSVKQMLNYSRAGWQIDELIDVFDNELKEFLKSRIDTWKTREEFLPSLPFLNEAINSHVSSNYIASCSVIYPQIEGMMRRGFIKDNPGLHGRNTDKLVSHVTDKIKSHYNSLTTYLPDRFKDYLKNIYLKDFNPNSMDNTLSRHSNAHGASNASQHTKKASLLGLLIFCQVSQQILLPTEEKS